MLHLKEFRGVHAKNEYWRNALYECQYRMNQGINYQDIKEEKEAQGQLKTWLDMEESTMVQNERIN